MCMMSRSLLLNRLYDVLVTLFNQISSKFHIWNAAIKSLLKFEYRFCLMNDNQDGRQNDRRLSVCTCVQCRGTLTQSFLSQFLSNLIYTLPPSNSLSSSNAGFVRQRITKMAEKMAAASRAICSALCRSDSPTVLDFLITSLFFSGYLEKGYLFVCFSSQSTISHIRTISYLPGLNQY